MLFLLQIFTMLLFTLYVELSEGSVGHRVQPFQRSVLRIFLIFLTFGLPSNRSVSLHSTERSQAQGTPARHKRVLQIS